VEGKMFVVEIREDPLLLLLMTIVGILVVAVEEVMAVAAVMSFKLLSQVGERDVLVPIITGSMHG